MNMDAIAEIAKTSAADKLANTVKDVIDYAVGPKRIAAIGRARAQVKVMDAKADAIAEELKARAMTRIQNREITYQNNIEAITQEAHKALPSPNEKTPSSDPVSPDFVTRFFEECQSISNEEMQQIWGKLLAGEVMSPGTFHPMTFRILKDMTPEDAKMFECLCRFEWLIGTPAIVILDENNDIYKKADVNFETIQHLQALRLLDFQAFGFNRTFNRDDVFIRYANSAYKVKSPNSKKIDIGRIMLTAAGRQLAKLTLVEHIVGFDSYCVDYWHSKGLELEKIS